MTETSMEARFKELEAKHEAFKIKTQKNFRNVKIGGFIFLILFVGFMVMGATNQSGQVLSISKIIVPSDGLQFVTPDGKKIAEIMADEYGGGLDIYNNQGKYVGGLFADEYGGGLGILNNQGEIVGAMGLSEYGGFLAIANNQGESVVAIGASENGGLIKLKNNQGEKTWSAP